MDRHGATARAQTSRDRRAMRERDAAIARSERLRRGLVTGSVAGSFGIAGALGVAALMSQPATSSNAGAGTSTGHHAAQHPHLSPAQRLLRRLQQLTAGDNSSGSGQSGSGQSGTGQSGTGQSGTGQSGTGQSSGGGLSSGTGPSHVTTSGS